jgi:uncharacterized protein
MKHSPPQAVLLVDGYNIVGAWQALMAIHSQYGLAAARRELVASLTGYAAYHGYETQVVFDAQYNDAPANRETVTRYLMVHYTQPGQTADSYIEKTCADFRHDLRKFEQRLIVATNDRAQQLTVIGYGAEWLSAQQLWNDVEFAGQRVRGQQTAKGKPTGRFLMNALDPAAREKLSRLRFGNGESGQKSPPK